jgi:hypothetical protein
MAFGRGIQNGITRVGAGEIYGTSPIILSMDNFEDGLKVGRFAKYDNGRVDNIDGSATPSIAGLVLRNITTALEDGSTLTTKHNAHVDLLRIGLATVEVKSGDTPAFNGPVYVVNTATDDAGKATTSSTSTVATNARFIQEVKAGVWLIELSGS